MIKPEVYYTHEHTPTQRRSFSRPLCCTSYVPMMEPGPGCIKPIRSRPQGLGYLLWGEKQQCNQNIQAMRNSTVEICTEPPGVQKMEGITYDFKGQRAREGVKGQRSSRRIFRLNVFSRWRRSHGKECEDIHPFIRWKCLTTLMRCTAPGGQKTWWELVGN